MPTRGEFSPLGRRGPQLREVTGVGRGIAVDRHGGGEMRLANNACNVWPWRWIATSGARYLVGASSYPRHRFSSGFYPFFALSISAFARAFWLRASVRAWAGQGRDRATEFFESATSLASFSQIFVADSNNSFSWPSKRLLHAFTF